MTHGVGFEQFIYLANSEFAPRLRRKYMMRCEYARNVRLLAARFTEVSNDAVVSGISLSSQ